jgi:hypothetical protein
VYWVLPVRCVFTSALCSSLSPPSPCVFTSAVHWVLPVRRVFTSAVHWVLPVRVSSPLQFTESSQSAVSSPLQFTESSQSAVSSPLPSAVHWVLPVRCFFTSVLCSSLSPPSSPCLHLCLRILCWRLSHGSLIASTAWLPVWRPCQSILLLFWLPSQNWTKKPVGLLLRLDTHRTENTVHLYKHSC